MISGEGGSGTTGEAAVASSASIGAKTQYGYRG